MCDTVYTHSTSRAHHQVSLSPQCLPFAGSCFLLFAQQPKRANIQLAKHAKSVYNLDGFSRFFDQLDEEREKKTEVNSETRMGENLCIRSKKEQISAGFQGEILFYCCFYVQRERLIEGLNRKVHRKLSSVCVFFLK